MKKIKKQELARLLQQWQADYTVLAPSRATEVAAMAEWDGKDIGFLEWYRNTVIPPKEVILPNMEELFRFQKEGAGYRLTAAAPEAKQLVFGIRPCDARALAIIDLVFQDTYPDDYYLSRRQNTLLVGLGCTRPCDSCFCTSMGVSPGESGDVDLMCTDTGDELMIEGITAKGKELLEKTGGLAEASPEDGSRRQEAIEQARQRITRHLDTGGIAEKLQRSFEDKEFWERIAAKCITCGVCTFLCPTCYCFDINDEKTAAGGGARFRNWDSCSFAAYTRMPAENPREQKWQRVRQKVCHKYEFYPRLFNIIACTGCGRCIRLCPVNWDITETLKSVPAPTTT